MSSIRSRFSDERLKELRREFDSMNLPPEQFQTFVEWVEHEEDLKTERWQGERAGALRYLSPEFDY